MADVVAIRHKYMAKRIEDLSELRTFLYPELGTQKRLKVANVAMSCDRDPGVNRTRMVNIVNTIMQENPEVDLVVFGEMIVGWYVPGSSLEYQHQISEQTTGETSQMLAPVAKKHNIHICFGMSEFDGEMFFNTQILLNPQGEIRAVHRKRNLKEHERQAGYQPGSKMMTITDIKGVKTGIVICSDTASFHTMWELIKSRLDLIIVSLTDDDKDDFVTKFQARLFDAWVVTANRYGKEDEMYWPGLIVVTDPLGEIQSAKQGREQYSVNEMHFAERRLSLRSFARNVWVKLRLIVHVLRNLKRALSYI
ncbi:MAG: carbon-nitrogen hydrolase family protein [Anaerolineae bacterium]|nr:carbon-nitrogen hydrolase family protein [Anaerolineae bacterium]